MKDILIREFLEKYAEQAAELIQHNLLTINAKNYTDEVIQNLIQIYSAANLMQQSITKTMLIATQDDKLVGIGCISNDLISTVFVDIHHHKFGIGKSIMHALELIAKNNGIKRYRFVCKHQC
jgi:hypothetical protein